jgi:O-antigen/teichoic acid export membrane protein
MLTIALNILLIPQLHYLGAAIATCACYFFMMIVSYLLGQKYYPIPYATKKIIAYLVVVSICYALHKVVYYLYPALWLSITFGLLLMALFSLLVLWAEKRELSNVAFYKRLMRKK